MNKNKDYIELDGFYDLREWDLPKKVFTKLWNIQLSLKHVQDRADYFRTLHKSVWDKAKVLSGDYQSILFRYSHKTTERTTTP